MKIAQSLLVLGGIVLGAAVMAGASWWLTMPAAVVLGILTQRL